MATGLNPFGYYLVKSETVESQLAALRAELTVSPETCQFLMGAAPPPQLRLYLESPKKFYVPKFFGLQRFGAARRIDIDDGEDVRLPFAGNLRPEQQEYANAFLAAARDDTRMGGILSLPCGFGKTVLGLYILSQLGKKTMIVVHKDFLLQQWRERIQVFLPQARVGLVKAKHLQVKDTDVVIASLQSLSMKEYEYETTFKGIGLVIVDEVHRTGTEVFSRALAKMNFRYSLGLSATVDRKDGLTKVFVWYLGDILMRRKREKDATVQVNVYDLRRFSHDSKYTEEHYLPFNGKPNVSRMINHICEYAPRTEFVVEMTARVLGGDPGRKALVLSDRKAHLRDMHNLFRDVHGIDSGFYIGGMTPDKLEESARKRVILATYSFASEGFDAKDLDTLVLATPKIDVEQSVGRILRTEAHLREREPIVMDFMDHHGLFRRQAAKRQTSYRKWGYSSSSIVDAADEEVSDTAAPLQFLPDA